MKFYPSHFSLWHFIWNGCFNSYFATQQLHCISFLNRYNFMTNSALSSQQSALWWYLTQDYLKLPSCTNTYLEINLCPWIPYSVGKENGFPSVVTALEIDTQVLRHNVGLTTLMDSPFPGLVKTVFKKHFGKITWCLSMCHFTKS